ncbi:MULTISPECIES: serine hydrolase domain-containing protein [Streptomyces]|uniref:Serine hydrolase n=1 Tax=Streptomyces dengpaensis TaxID=2049881 RepID=A0ABN5I8F2_9ACTN|nr:MULTISPECIES: serine hydrolase domain-containing protein [Streptomyces]AVH59450.1 serine hydrolase [Streptomyces dengpaensis]PIB05808.1 serine hydrolase [Streptomyces sp. HG99]
MTRSCGRLRRGAATAAAVGMLAVPASAVAVATATTTTATATEPRSPSDTPSDPVRTLTPAVKRQLDAAVRQVMREAHVPGVTVGIWTPSQGTYVKSFGVADKSNGQKMSPDLYLRIGSETKTFTVTALLKLVDEGKVGLDDPIGTYVDGVPNGDEITLRELAGMRSGLFNYSEDPDFFKALTSDPQRPFTPRQLLDYAFRHPVLFPPGEKFSYCNTNLILLGLVVEKAGGLPIEDYVQRNVLDPAGMHHTLFPTDAAFPTPHAQGYTNQTANGKIADTADWNPSWAWAAGAMISTLHDLRIWAPTVATGVLPDGKALISPATQKQRLTTPPTTIPGAGYGLGIFNVHGWIGHNGSLPGYESLTVFLPSARATLVVLLNTDINHDGQEPGTLLGEAITKVISPRHVFDLAAQPAAH